jgi:peptidoglycan/xylan/chitin deacetylase (PgdA/CDA1 family)
MQTAQQELPPNDGEMVREVLTSTVRAVDAVVTRAALALGRESPALLAFAFHGLFENEEEIRSGVVSPIQPLLVADLERLIEHFLRHGYEFVSPMMILEGLKPTGRYVLLSFDDGYANNLRALPILRRFSVPATFFVSANHAVEGKAFWWDVLYRERRRRNAGPRAIRRELQSLKRLPYHAIEAHVRSEFGVSALRPVGDLDRPLQTDEIKLLGREPLATLGNHTADHAILTALGDAEAASQIRNCQEVLAELTGHTPLSIAYPNGACDGRITQIAKQETLALGFTVGRCKSILPLRPEQLMAIPRYVLRGGSRLLAECDACRSDVQLLNRARRVWDSFSAHRASARYQSHAGY